MLLKEDVDTLFEGIEVSDELKESFGVKLEVLLSEKASEIRRETDEANKIILEAESEVIKEQHEEQIDKYLSYAVKEWMTENKLAVDSGVKVEAAEKLISGMIGLLREYNINLDEKSSKIVEMAGTKVSKLERELTEQIEENLILSRQLEDLQKDDVISEVCYGLTESQKEKIKELASEIEYTDVGRYKRKIEIIKESHFNKRDKNTQERSNVQIPNMNTNAYVASLAALIK
jgi:hypothetical protein